MLGGPMALNYLDQTCFDKKGDRSVGVARQYNRRSGKIDNCQVGLFAAPGRGGPLSRERVFICRRTGAVIRHAVKRPESPLKHGFSKPRLPLPWNW